LVKGDPLFGGELAHCIFQLRNSVHGGFPSAARAQYNNWSHRWLTWS
jgi:hypothetical protein